MIRSTSDANSYGFVGESFLLELMSTGMPLTYVLDALCATLNTQIGNVVSAVLFLDDDEFCQLSLLQSAANCGLHSFSCTAIVTSAGALVATLDIYSSTPRPPTSEECILIDRVTALAGAAVESHRLISDSRSVPSCISATWLASSEEEHRFQN